MTKDGDTGEHDPRPLGDVRFMREVVTDYLGYFSHHERYSEGLEVWRIGRETTERWLALLEQDPIPLDEVKRLLAVADKYKYTSSAWIVVNDVFIDWARFIGCPLPHDDWPYRKPTD